MSSSRRSTCFATGWRRGPCVDVDGEGVGQQLEQQQRERYRAATRAAHYYKTCLMCRLQERFFIGTVADTIHTIQKIIIYSYRLLQSTSKINFKK
jgi:hypothetical protein